MTVTGMPNDTAAVEHAGPARSNMEQRGHLEIRRVSGGWPLGSGGVAELGIAGWLRRRWRLLQHARVVPRRSIALLLLAHVAGAASVPVVAASTGWLVARTDALARGAPRSTVLAPLGLVGLLILYELVADILIMPVRVRTSQLVDGSVKQRVRQAIASHPGVEHLEDQRFRDLASSPTIMFESIGGALESQIQVLARYTSAVLSALILARVSAPVAVVALAVLIAKRLYLRRIYAPFLSDSGRRFAPQVREAGYWQTVGASLLGAKEVRIFGFADETVRGFDENAGVVPAILSTTFRRASLMAWPAWVADLIATGLPIWFLVREASAGRISIGVLAVALGGALGIAVIGGVGNETYIIEATLSGVEALDRLEEMQARPSHSAPARAASTLPAARRRPPLIELDGVSFAYPGASAPVLRDLHLRLEPGQSVAIVGENGVGKSTLIKLLCRFYEPTEGRILADGIDVRTIPIEEWRSQLAVVFQSFKQLHLPAWQNIALADWDHPERDRLVAEAVAASGATKVIDALPHGLATTLNRGYKGGADLSGGQWQRIALARALYAAAVGAQVLVLDEPTAHLDVGAEIALFDQLLTHAAGKTAIVVSHRYSTVRRAQRIVVLGDGGVIEDGSHADLLALGGTYAQLYNLQADAFVASAD
jgi:ATP-binding cassette subfamily B protein